LRGCRRSGGCEKEASSVDHPEWLLDDAILSPGGRAAAQRDRIGGG